MKRQFVPRSRWLRPWLRLGLRAQITITCHTVDVPPLFDIALPGIAVTGAIYVTIPADTPAGAPSGGPAERFENGLDCAIFIYRAIARKLAVVADHSVQ